MCECAENRVAVVEFIRHKTMLKPLLRRKPDDL
jgi:hypothetical protein